MEKVLIIGAAGFLGLRLVRRFLEEGSYSVIAADLLKSWPYFSVPYFSVDITDYSSVERLFSKVSPDLTIVPAAMTNVDACEKNPVMAEKINALGPKYIGECVKKTGGRMILLSTDFVFDGKKGLYREEDTPNPISIYGKTKLEGERNVLSLDIPVRVCRTSVLYGWPEKGQHENFFTWALKSLRKGTALRIVKRQITTPTLVDDLAEGLYLLRNFNKAEVIHTTGPEPISRYEFVMRIVDIFGLDRRLVEPIDSFPQVAKRPDDSSLDTSKLRSLIDYPFKKISVALRYLRDTERKE